jgi:hypothetical protein
VRWGNPEGRTTQELSQELDELGRGGHWYHANKFAQINAAYKWHVPWHVWKGRKLDDLTDEDRLEMIVYLTVVGNMEAWEQYVNEPKSTPSGNS